MTIRCQRIPIAQNHRALFGGRVAILIPAYNEGAHLEQLIDRCRATDPALLVVVDDASTDHSAEVLARVQALPGAPLVVLTNPVNLGKQGSVRRGLRYLMSERLDGVALIDGDLQHDPHDLPHLAEHLTLFDIVIGARTQVEMPWHRRLSNWLVNAAITSLTGVDFVDVQSGLRLYTKPVSDVLAARMPSDGGFGVEHESLAILAQAASQMGAGLHIAAAPVHCRYGNETSHIRPTDILQLAAETVRQGLRMRRSLRAPAAFAV